MKRKHLLGFLGLVLPMLAGAGYAAGIIAAGNGNWSSTVPNAPWPGGIIPGANDSVAIGAPIVVTVDSTATCAYLSGSGTLTMAAGARLDVLGDALGAHGAQELATLNATAPGNMVNYHGNAFWAKRTDYHHLEFSGHGDFYNGSIPGSGATPMTIAGNMTVSGTNIAVQMGADITIGGNLLLLGATNKWDSSSFYLTVTSNTVMTGIRALLVDLDGALGSNYFGGNVTIGSNVLAWNVSDVTHWGVGGSLTNFGLIAGKGYGSIAFDGTGVISGKPISLPTITVNGTYTIGTTITLTTNTPALNGTLVFDLANTNQLVLQTYPLNPLTLYYDGALEVINSGAPPAPGSSYQLFNAGNYGGGFVTTTFPPLQAGLSWLDELFVSGSIKVEGTINAPTLAWSRNNQILTLSWDSASFPDYRVEARTNSSGIGKNWADTGSGTVSPFVTPINPAGPPVFFRLVKP